MSAYYDIQTSCLQTKLNMKRYYYLKKILIEYLGGQCIACGNKEKLEFDHINSENRKFVITQKLLVYKFDKILEEIEKCQLLCHKCHMKKSMEQRGKKMAEGRHGTVSLYRYCKCNKCKKANSEYMKNYHAKINFV